MDNLFLLLFFAGIVGVVYFWRKDKKKRNISAVVLVVSFILFGVTSPGVKDGIEDGKEAAEETAKADNEKDNEEEEPQQEEKEEEEKEPEKEEKEEVKELPDEIDDLHISDVRDDTTGNWKKVVDSKNFNMPDNAMTYYEEYMKDGEVHYLISFATNTTTAISDLGGILYVNITEYKKREEHSADTIGNGMTLKTYNVYTDDGEIEEIEE